MRQETIMSAVLWVVALGIVAYLFKGNENSTLAIILIGILGFIDVIGTDSLFKKNK